MQAFHLKKNCYNNYEHSTQQITKTAKLEPHLEYYVRVCFSTSSSSYKLLFFAFCNCNYPAIFQEKTSYILPTKSEKPE